MAAETGFLYDFARLLHETDEVGGEISNTYAVSTQDEFGDLLSEDGEQLTHQYDAMANTNALLDDSGVLQANYKYYAFGQVSSFSVEGDYWASLTVDQWWNMTVDQWWGLPAQLTTHMLAGGRKQYYLDPDTQLYLLGGGVNGRYYDPNTARFLSEDPIRQQSGDVNLFAYVQDNPINRLN